MELSSRCGSRWSGLLYLRGVARPFRMQLKADGGDTGWRVSAGGVLKLSAYGVEPPSQFGIRVADEVKIGAEFEARQAVRRAGR